jgi:hypothetical protein
MQFKTASLIFVGALCACSQPSTHFAEARIASAPLVTDHAPDASRSLNPPPPVPERLIAGDALSPWGFAPSEAAFAPSKAAFAPGEATTPTWRALDRADADGIFDVVIEDPSGTRFPVAESARHQAAATLAADDARLWLAFEQGAADWGQGGPLRAERQLLFGALYPGHSVPTWVPLATPFADAEAPTLTVDPTGRPWLFARTLQNAPIFDPGGKENEEAANRRTAWTLQVAVLTEDGWTAPMTLPDSSGPEDGALELVWQGTTLVASYFTDGRAERLFNDAETGPWDRALPGPGGWHTARLTFENGAAAPPDLAELSTPLERDMARLTARPESNLYWGDLHRHTDASRCKMDTDGDLLDAYRYALGTARLDFMAVTNHFQHITTEGWEREVATANAFNQLDGFVAFVGYERALPLGHWTMVATGAADPRRALDDGVFAPYHPRNLWDEHDAHDWLAIPHQLTDRAAPLTWEPAGALDPIAEVFQSRRGAYEARDGWRRDLGGDPDALWAQDYLNQGRIMGFVASSDHATTASAFTGVRLEPGQVLSRASVVAALRARHTVAASTRADLAITVDTAETTRAYQAGDMLDASTINGPLTVRFITDASQVTMLDLVHGRPDTTPVEHSTGTLDQAQTSDVQAQLSLRIGRAERTRSVQVELQGAQFLDDVRAFSLEADDQLSGANPNQVSLESTLDLRDEDGFLAPLTYDPDQPAKLIVKVQSPGKNVTKELALPKLLDHPAQIFWAAGARTDLRLDRLHQDLKLEGELILQNVRAGDWLYLRAITRSGDILWTSPIFVR